MSSLRREKRFELSDRKGCYKKLMPHLRPARGGTLAVVAKDDGELTANVSEIHRIFADTWTSIYNRLRANLQNFQDFKENSGTSIKCQPTVCAQPRSRFSTKLDRCGKILRLGLTGGGLLN